MDIQGERVEDWKIKPDAAKTLKGIRKLQKKIRDFTVVKNLILQQLEGAEQKIMTESKNLFDMLPKEKTNNLQGMNFVQEEQPQEMEQGNAY